MALIQLTYYSEALRKQTSVDVLIPNDAQAYVTKGNPHYDRPMKTLYLLHGYSGCSQDWLLESHVKELSLTYHMMIIMPNGDNSFYLNQKGTGNQYEAFVGRELVDYIQKTFGVIHNRQDTFIGGYSMGGYGAVHTGLKYPGTFGKIFGLSSAFIIHHINNKNSDFKTELADYDYYKQVFGDLDGLDKTDRNPEVIVKERLRKNEHIQPIYMACGLNDFLIEDNQRFYDFLVEESVDVTYEEETGDHNWQFWNKYMEKAIEWIL